LAPLLAANPGAVLYVDADTAIAVPGLPSPTVVRPGERFSVAGATVEALGGVHAAVYRDFPGCTNVAYLIDDGALLHPGDSFTGFDGDVDVLAVAIDGPWLKIAEAVDYVHAARPRVAIPMHEGETADPGKYAGILTAFCPDGVVRTLPRDVAVTVT
jgi:L-ascorbate metabolism protein UlaG (beta-lactamase superfamily)